MNAVSKWKRVVHVVSVDRSLPDRRLALPRQFRVEEKVRRICVS